MQFAIAINLAAIFPCLFHPFCLAGIFRRALAERLLQPGVKPAWMDTKHAAHDPDIEFRTMRLDERVLHLFGVALEPMAGSRLTSGEIRGRFF